MDEAKMKQANASNEAIQWLGTWRNQYGSELDITSQENSHIAGRFRTALPDSSLYGQESVVVGIHLGDLISFSVGGGQTNQLVVGYTGILRGGKIETLWHMVSGEKLTAKTEGELAQKKRVEAWQAFVTSADTFERVG